MKTSIINARVDSLTKKSLKDIASENDKPVSDIVRDAISFFIEKKKGINPDDSDERELLNEDLSLLISWQVTELIFWITDKRDDSSILRCEETFNGHRETILNMENNPFCYADIMVEFRKVSDELYQFLYTDNHNGDIFNFSCLEYNGFNYCKLRLFVEDIKLRIEGVEKVYM
jgi:hypothetical protein